jgi:hypothetical protein
MAELLDRHELPAQAVFERDEAVTAIVPVHRDVLALSPDVRTNTLTIASAQETVEGWYNEDMAYYLAALASSGTTLPHLVGYEEFQANWKLDAVPDEHGFLALSWREPGSHHPITFSPIPITLYNQWDANGEYYSPEQNRRGRYIECISRHVDQGEVVFMDPDRMRSYGNETDIAQIHEDIGVAEVQGLAFNSEYHRSLAKALLLRDFAVYYLNELAELADTPDQGPIV